MSEAIYLFNTKQQPSLAEVGGKAESLIRSTQAGLPVPDGLALSVSFFTEWTAQIKASKQWAALLAEPTKTNCDAAKYLAKALSFTDVMRSEFDRHLSQLDADGIFAVRSSSPEEDLAGTSFAGMYETFLGTQTEQLERTIAKSYSSMFDFRVMEYKAKQGLSAENATIAIVVQQQIASDVSGVGFSLNPLNNCFDEAVINASFGLGEAIVSGQVISDEFIVEKNELRVLSFEIREKKCGLQLSTSGGVEDLPITDAYKASLTQAQVLEITRLINKVEAYYKKPIDIEWAYFEDKLYLLQARPITTYIPLFPEMLTQPGEKKKLYADILGISQGFDEALSVLGGDIWGLAFEAMKQGTTPVGEGGIILTAHGRQYMQVHNILKIYGKKRGFGILNSLANNLVGLEDHIYKEYCAETMNATGRGAKRAIFKLMGSMLPTGLRLVFKPNALIADMENTAEQLLQTFNGLKNDRPFAEIVDDGFEQFRPMVLLMIAYGKGAMAYYSIKKMLKGTDAEMSINALLMNIESNPTSQMGHAMFRLAQFEEVQQSTSEADFLHRLEARNFSPEFLQLWDDYVVRYGSRSLKEIDVATPRAMDMPEILYRQLRSLSIADNQLSKVCQRKKKILSKARAIAKKKGRLKSLIMAFAPSNKLTASVKCPSICWL